MLARNSRIGGEQELAQVCANLNSPETAARELRALAAAAKEHPRARRWLDTRVLLAHQRGDQ